MGERFRPDDLEMLTAGLFAAVGLDANKAGVTARLLVAADLMGHTTHGLQLAGPYLDAARKGTMTVAGEPAVVAETAGVPGLGWRLPARALAHRAGRRACDQEGPDGRHRHGRRPPQPPYRLPRDLPPGATDQGLMLILACPTRRCVGRTIRWTGAGHTPDPIAMGIPTHGVRC